MAVFLFGVKVLSSDNPKHGYNAATGKYEDLMSAGIIDPTKVRRDPYFIADWDLMVLHANRVCFSSSLRLWDVA